MSPEQEIRVGHRMGRWRGINTMNKMIVFIRAYFKSMRLYYAFITGIAGWAGVAYYDYLTAGSSHPLLLHKCELLT